MIMRDYCATRAVKKRMTAVQYPSGPPGVHRTVSRSAGLELVSYASSSLITRFVFPTHGHQSADKRSLTTVSRSDIRLIQFSDSSALGFGPEVALNWLFPYPLVTRAHPHTLGAPYDTCCMMRSASPHRTSVHTPRQRTATKRLRIVTVGSCGSGGR
jgi:hypothetical protein